MIINIHWPHRHKYKVLRSSITSHGAVFVCRCLAQDYYAWQSYREKINAEIVLALRHSAVLEERFKVS